MSNLQGTTTLEPTSTFKPSGSQNSELLASDRETLIDEYMPMVRAIATRLRRDLPRHLDFEDLVSAGTVGLIDAITKFRVGYEPQFRSYAQCRIRGSIIDSLRKQDWAPRDLRRSGRKVKQAVVICTARLGRSPDEEEIATEVHWTLAELRLAMEKMHSLELRSLEGALDEGTDLSEIIMFDPAEPGALFYYLQNELREQLSSALEELSHSERLVITLSYYEELSLKEVAHVLQVGESRASQIRSRAVRKLRAALVPAITTYSPSVAKCCRRRQVMQNIAKTNSPKSDGRMYAPQYFAPGELNCA